MRQQSGGETGPPCSSGGSAGGVKAGFPPGADILRRWGGGRQVEESWGPQGTYTEVWLRLQMRGWVHGELCCTGESGFIFTIKLVLKWLLKEYCNAEPFFFTLYISSSSLCTCHQVDSQCNKNRQLLLNQILAVWWVGPQNWHPGSSCSWGVLRLWDGVGDPLPFIGVWKWSESGHLLQIFIWGLFYFYKWFVFNDPIFFPESQKNGGFLRAPGIFFFFFFFGSLVSDYVSQIGVFFFFFCFIYNYLPVVKIK